MPTYVYATFGDVRETYEGTIPDDRRNRIDALIRRASAKLTHLVPGIPERIEEGSLDPELPRGMVVEAVLRQYRNPSGATNQNVGPFSQSLNSNASKSEAITFPREELDMLREDPGRKVPTSIMISVPARSRLALDADGSYHYTPEWRGGLR